MGNKLSLPLLSADGQGHISTAVWNGLTPVTPVDARAVRDGALSSAEPVEPQGAYNQREAEARLELPSLPRQQSARPVELLAPAGGLDAAFAAFIFGADAIYLGLKKFSARAEAENFTLAELDEITAYAHQLQPRRRVFVTVNTLIRQDELGELVEALAALAEIGVDAVIIQDLGVYALIREHFPELELHASTQLSVHNRAGAEVLHRLGFRRVVLARELTFEEVHDITATAGIETEVFIHGALCYSYSGLCLFSAQTLGRSGNRGKCAYSCRDSYDVSGAPETLRDGSAVKRDPAQGFPFSMKDLALPDHVPALKAAAVSCFKIEGRKKSPLYVATTTDYYRKLIDGRLTSAERPDIEADLQTVFSRPWTRLFLQSHKDKEVADRDTVGHRGTMVGNVAAVLEPGTSAARLRFRTRRALERHDGLQIDLPILGKPFGFAVERMWTLASRRKTRNQEVFRADAGAMVEVALPVDHPALPVGAPVYCSSSQAVKQRYRHGRPRPGLFRTRRAVSIEVTLTCAEMLVTGRVMPQCPRDAAIEVRRSLAGPFAPANDAAAMAQAVRMTFARLGQTRLDLNSIVFRNDEQRFVPVSHMNQLRRDLTAGLEDALQQALAQRVATIQAAICPVPADPVPADSHEPRKVGPSVPKWSIKVDRLSFLDAFDAADFAGIDEVVVDLTRDHSGILDQKLAWLSAQVGREHIRLALPALARQWEDKGLRQKIEHLQAVGWNKWEAANLSAWHYLGVDVNHPERSRIDLATDWSVYAINRLAARQLMKLGVSRFVLSPEDGFANVRSLLAEFGSRAVLIVYQDTPLFLAESCAYANLIGGCPGKANCRFESMDMTSSHGEKVTALDYHCRTIVLNQGPFCLSTRLAELRAVGARSLRVDFIYRSYEPAEVRRRWRLVRAGRPVPRGHAANFDRGLL
jgi:putative protease